VTEFRHQRRWSQPRVGDPPGFSCGPSGEGPAAQTCRCASCLPDHSRLQVLHSKFGDDGQLNAASGRTAALRAMVAIRALTLRPCVGASRCPRAGGGGGGQTLPQAHLHAVVAWRWPFGESSFDRGGGCTLANPAAQQDGHRLPLDDIELEIYRSGRRPAPDA